MKVAKNLSNTFTVTLEQCRTWGRYVSFAKRKMLDTSALSAQSPLGYRLHWYTK